MAKRAITSRDSMRQVRLHVAKRAQLRFLYLLYLPSLILNPVGPCQPNSRTPKATWAAETAVSPPTFLSLFYECEIYISRVQPTCTQAAEFARKSTMQNYCPHTSFPVLEFGYADEESHLPHRRATLCSFTPGDLHSR